MNFPVPASHNDCVAIVPAGGIGERLGLGPKAFLQVNGRTLLQQVTGRLRLCVPRIVVGVPDTCMADARRLLADSVEIIRGGETRQSTVERLFRHTTESLVLIHDVTRPFASVNLMRRVLEAAAATGAAAAMTAPPIPVATVSGGIIRQSFDRTEVMLPQSPQAFRREVLQQALDHARAERMERQTTWQLVEAAGGRIMVVPGEESNIKITTVLDWEIAQRVIGPMLGDGN